MSDQVQSCLSGTLQSMNGQKQGDALACLLFNIALEIRDSKQHKEVQLLAYADDIYIISRSEAGLKRAFKALEASAKKKKTGIDNK